MENEKQTLFRASFDEMCDLIDRIDWMKRPYRGAMQQLAELEGVTAAGIWNAVKVYRNERLMIRLFEILEQREAAARRALERVYGNMDILFDALKSGRLDAVFTEVAQ